LSVYNHLRSDAWKTFNALEAARIAREVREIEQAKLGQQILTDMADILIELFSHFAKDRIHVTFGCVHITQYDVRERDTQEPWPSETIRLSHFDGKYGLAVGRGVVGKWDMLCNGAAGVTLQRAVDIVHGWWVAQRKELRAQSQTA
jgi:hypothetical protein